MTSTSKTHTPGTRQMHDDAQLSNLGFPLPTSLRRRRVSPTQMDSSHNEQSRKPMANKIPIYDKHNTTCGCLPYTHETTTMASLCTTPRRLLLPMGWSTWNSMVPSNFINKRDECMSPPTSPGSNILHHTNNATHKRCSWQHGWKQEMGRST